MGTDLSDHGFATADIEVSPVGNKPTKPESPGGSNSMEPSVHRVKLDWSNLTYSVEVRSGGVGFKAEKSSKVILDDISGVAKPGQLVAIMGPSGSGKSSLLNALAGRLPRRGVLQGAVMVNGAPRTDSYYSVAAYSLQDDLLFSNLTVRETLRVAASLRLDRTASPAKREQAVENIMVVMGLMKAADTQVGVLPAHRTTRMRFMQDGGVWHRQIRGAGNASKRGISGGERKRTNIAVEIISSPSLVFLDEPTSGLDAFQAKSVMQALHGLAKRGHTVLSVVHQPRSCIYQMFEQLQVISEGMLIYSGRADDACHYFAELGYLRTPGFNIADFLLDMVSVDNTSRETADESTRQIHHLAKLQAERSTDNGERESDMHSTSPQYHEALPGRRGAGYLRQTAVLSWRCLTQARRNTIPNLLGTAPTVVVLLILGLLYSNIPPANTFDQLGLMFFITANVCVSSLLPVAAAFPIEQAIITRERDARAYVAHTYFMAKVVIETPFQLLPRLVLYSALYWWVGLNPSAGAFFFYLLSLAINYCACSAGGYMVGGWTGSVVVSQGISAALMLVWMIFGGLFISLASLSAASLWVAYLNPVAWTMIAVTLNEAETSTALGATFRNRLPPGLLHVTKWQALLFCFLLSTLFYGLALAGLIFTKPKYQPLATGRDHNASKRSRTSLVRQWPSSAPASRQCHSGQTKS